MPSMVRKQVYIEPRQGILLQRLGRERGLSEASLIRQAIDQYMMDLSYHDPSAWQAERDFITRLIQQGPVPGGRAWRREVFHER